MYRQSPVKSPDIKKHYSSNVNVFIWKVPHCVEETYIRAKRLISVLIIPSG